MASALGWQPYHLHMPIVWKSGSPNFPKPSGLVQTCRGIACFLPARYRYRGVLFHLITLRHTTVGSTPPDETSARRRDLYLTAYNIHKRQTFMPLAGFEPAILANEGTQTQALERGYRDRLFNNCASWYRMKKYDKLLLITVIYVGYHRLFLSVVIEAKHDNISNQSRSSCRLSATFVRSSAACVFSLDRVWQPSPLPRVKFRENPPSVRRVVRSGRTGRRTWRS